MLFNSFEFLLLYLPVALGGFFLLGRFTRAGAALWIALASVAFYGYWNPRFVALLLSSIAFNYAMGLWIARARSKERPGISPKAITTMAIVVDLAVLGVYKYANFFISTVDALSPADWSALDILLPLGISFFTFTQIAFIVDTYKGLAREFNPIHYLLFVTYFPHLIAGPVLHHKQMMPQFGKAEIYRPQATHILSGLATFALGLAKKVVLADSFSEFAQPVFNMANDGAPIPLGLAWLGVMAYTLQIYFDFSGYSDMAIGLSRLFGIELPINFNSPYKATNIIDFWRRWHMTLSQFLRDYLYIPLGGSRQGPVRRHVNLMITMLLGGLWHGANWTFVVWGGLHGLYLVAAHTWRTVRERFGVATHSPSLIGAITGRALTLLAVAVAWVFFRAESFPAALHLLDSMFHPQGSVAFTLDDYLLPRLGLMHTTGLFAAGLAIVYFLPNAQQMAARWNQPGPRLRFECIGALAVTCFVLVAIGASRGVSEFIYFNF